MKTQKESRIISASVHFPIKGCLWQPANLLKPPDVFLLSMTRSLNKKLDEVFEQ